MEARVWLLELRSRLDAAEKWYNEGSVQEAHLASVYICQALSQPRGFVGGGSLFDTLRADSFNLRGNISNYYGNYELGRQSFMEATALYARARGANDLHVHIARSNLAISLQGLGRLNEAIGLLNEACAGMKGNLDQRQRAIRELVRTLGTLGAVQMMAGQFPEASESLYEAIRQSGLVGDIRLVPDYINEASHYNTLGVVFRKQQQTLKSLSAIETAISMLAPFWSEFGRMVAPALVVFIKNYDQSKQAAGITDDASIVAKCRDHLPD